MSNHYHLVVKLNPVESNAWTDEEVLDRWTTLFRGPLVVQRHLAGHKLNAVELESLRSATSVFRSRLNSLSWFMKCLNEPTARKANREDHCSGHFWEARFHSVALCSDQALIAAMAYVDLNPIRAGIAKMPETSAYTSIKARIEARQSEAEINDAVAKMLERHELSHFNQSLKPLLKFAEHTDDVHCETLKALSLPIYEHEYLKLVDASGRIIIRGKTGCIAPDLTPILSRLKLSTNQWLQVSTGFSQYFRNGHLRLIKAA